MKQSLPSAPPETRANTEPGATTTLPLEPAEGHSATAANPCPACGSAAYGSLLPVEAGGTLRTLVSCSRCGLLRFLAVAPNPDASNFRRFLFTPELPRGFAAGLLDGLKRRARQGLLCFAAHDEKASSAGWLVQVDAPGGACCRTLTAGQWNALALTPRLADAQTALHRDGVWAVVTEADTLPLRVTSCARVLRLGGLAGEADPASWLTQAVRRLYPDGHIVLQVFDCSSWGFLLCGSRWVGLEADNAVYAYRAEDLEVLLELCGMRVRRRSHHFPWMNALVWASSLFPALHRAVQQGPAGSAPSTLALLLYLGAVTMVFPLALLEGLCHAGSVMMVEAERKR